MEFDVCYSAFPNQPPRLGKACCQPLPPFLWEMCVCLFAPMAMGTGRESQSGCMVGLGKHTRTDQTTVCRISIAGRTRKDGMAVCSVWEHAQRHPGAKKDQRGILQDTAITLDGHCYTAKTHCPIVLHNPPLSLALPLCGEAHTSLILPSPTCQSNCSVLQWPFRLLHVPVIALCSSGHLLHARVIALFSSGHP